MVFIFVFGIGTITIILGILALSIGLWDFSKHPDAYKCNLDREPWLR